MKMLLTACGQRDTVLMPLHICHFLKSRAQSICSIAGGASVAPSYLLFGCRGEKTDFYYSQLWQQLLAEGILAPKDGLLTAFSRDQKQKVYVQDKLRQHSKLMWDLIQQVASMVCVLSSHPVLFRMLQVAHVHNSSISCRGPRTHRRLVISPAMWHFVLTPDVSEQS